MAEQDIHALQAAVKALLEAQGESTRELRRAMGSLEALPALFQNQAEVLQRGFSNNAKILAEIEVARAQADAQGLEGAWTQMAASLEEAVTDYAESVTAITQRYQKLQEELSRDAAKRVQQLDGPALELMNVDLEHVVRWYRDVFGPESEDVLDALGILGTMRETTLGTYIEVLGQQVTQFVQLRAGCRERLASLLHATPTREPVEYVLPLYIVEIEREGAAGAGPSTETTAYVAPDPESITPASDDVSGVHLSHQALFTLAEHLNDPGDGASYCRRALRGSTPMPAAAAAELRSRAAECLRRSGLAVHARSLDNRLERGQVTLSLG